MSAVSRRPPTSGGKPEIRPRFRYDSGPANVAAVTAPASQRVREAAGAGDYEYYSARFRAHFAMRKHRVAGGAFFFMCRNFR